MVPYTYEIENHEHYMVLEVGFTEAVTLEAIFHHVRGKYMGYITIYPFCNIARNTL